MPIDVERAMSLLRDLSEAQKHGIRKTYEQNSVLVAAVVAYDRVQDLESRLARATALLETVIVPDGHDAGVILLSDASTTTYDEHLRVHVYDHENFSPLGDALVELHKTLTAPTP